MSRGNPEQFPWGSNEPGRMARLAFAVALGSLAVLIVRYDFLLDKGPAHHFDFGPVWFATRALLGGRNPYDLIGPHREFAWTWRMTYPATAVVAAIPFAAFRTELSAAMAFSGISTFLLAWGSTKDGWHRAPAFAGLPFLVAVAASQWSMILAASLFLPVLSVLWICKPTIGAALGAGAKDSRQIALAVVAGAVLFLMSIFLLPTWPTQWFGIVAHSHDFKSPISQPAGIFILAAALRWRRADAWLLMLMAIIPQSPGIYDLLIILFAIPRTYREAAVLSMATTAGAFMLNLVPTTNVDAWMSGRGLIVVATCYLPATVMVLNRPNEGDSPAWIVWLSRLVARSGTAGRVRLPQPGSRT